MTVYKVCIIGSGPAAHTSAIYAGRANLKPLVFEGEDLSIIGGQLMTTTEVENFPGFPKGISGQDLCERLREQSSACGAEIRSKTVTKLDLYYKPYRVYTGDTEYIEAQTIIIATGATANKLTFEGSDTFWQRGISACAVCDGALPMFRNQPIVVVGGGDSACEEALFLTKFASKVYLVHRRDSLRASKIMQDRLFSHPKITFIGDSQIIQASGGTRGNYQNVLTSITITNVKTNDNTMIECAGLFYGIGHSPATSFLKDTPEVGLDEDGYIIVDPGTTCTTADGVFAAGDVQDRIYRQAITSAASGCMAALDAERYLENI